MNRRRSPKLRMEERAIIRTWDIFGDETTALKYYGKVVDLSPTGLQLLTQQMPAVGEQLAIDISMEGRSEACSFSGVTRWVAPSADEVGYLVGIEVINDNHGAQWRHKFH